MVPVAEAVVGAAPEVFHILLRPVYDLFHPGGSVLLCPISGVPPFRCEGSIPAILPKGSAAEKRCKLFLAFWQEVQGEEAVEVVVVVVLPLTFLRVPLVVLAVGAALFAFVPTQR